MAALQPGDRVRVRVPGTGYAVHREGRVTGVVSEVLVRLDGMSLDAAPVAFAAWELEPVV